MRSAFLLSALVLLSGCAATVAVPPTALADTSARLDGRRVTVMLADGTSWRADALRLGPDSTSWFDATGGVLRAVPTADIVQIKHYDSLRLAQRGAALGVIVASLVTLAVQDADGTSGFLRNPTSYQDGGIGPVALAGVVIGAIGSATFSAPERYNFTRPDSLGTR